jgi:hypothetical protein
MKAFYEALQNAGKSDDEQLVELSAVCNADLEDVQKYQAFDLWEWWS